MITRRDLLRGSVGALALGGGLPGFLERALAAQQAQGEARHRRALVVLQLSGGNDGLNTIVPIDADPYYKARPQIAIAKKDARKIADGVGLHPSMKRLEALYGDGKLAIVQGVGYPNPNRSHFHSMDVWHSADPELRDTRTGWLGRALDRAPAARDNALYAVHLGEEAPRMLLSESQRVTSFNSPQDYALTLDRLNQGDKSKIEAAFERMHRASATSPADRRIDAVRRTASQAIASAKELRDVLAKSTPQATYPNSGVANQLKLAAQVLGTELPVHLVSLAMGGFDTHANQRGSHANLWSQIDEALAAFLEDLRKRERANDVVVLVFSEFGRRVAENGSAGTDHGAAAPLLVLGDAVRGGLYGSAPTFEKLDDGDLSFTTDFRRVYAPLLDRWLGVASEGVLGASFEPIGLFGAA